MSEQSLFSSVIVVIVILLFPFFRLCCFFSNQLTPNLEMHNFPPAQKSIGSSAAAAATLVKFNESRGESKVCSYFLVAR